MRVLPGGLADGADVVVEDGSEDPALPVLEDVAVVDSRKLAVVLAEDAVPHSGATSTRRRDRLLLLLLLDDASLLMNFLLIPFPSPPPPLSSV